MQMTVRNHFAILRNLRNIESAGVSDAHMDKLRRSFHHESWGKTKILPFRFVTAARYAPRLEDAIEAAMLKGSEAFERLPGRTGLLVDVSGSMNDKLSAKAETTRMDAACGLAIYLREKCEAVEVATFSQQAVVVPPRRGFALRDAITASQPHSCTNTGAALTTLRDRTPAWANLDRLIVITDEQSADAIPPAFAPNAYFINVATYKNGIGYGNGWTNISGWSERVVDYIAEVEADAK